MADDSLSLSLSGGSDDLEDSSCGREEIGSDYTFNILLVGDSGVGKTDLIGRLGEEEFKTKFHATIGMNMETRTLEVDGRLARLQIWDPSGSDRFRTVIKKYFHNAEGIMFVYDVNYRPSFQSIQNWMEEIKTFLAPEIRRILVGNKADIPLEEDRRVTFAEAEAVALSHGIKFFETSTISGQNVRRAFLALCQEMKESKPRALISPSPATSPIKAT